MIISKRWETVFAVLGVMFFAGSFSYALGSFLPSRTDTLLRYSSTGLMAIFLLQRWRHSFYTIIKGGWVWGIIFLLSISFAWANNSPQVISNIRGELIPMLLLSLYLASRFDLEEHFKITAWALGLSMFLSLIVVFVRPDLGIHPASSPWPGAWRGIFVHKNVFGAYSVLTAAIFFVLSIYAKNNQRMMWVLFSACIITIILSTSKTALILSFVAVLLIMLFERFRWMGTRTILWLNVSTFAIGGISGVMFIFWGTILRALGKDPTLTGRTLIWTFLIEEKIPDHLWFGYGRNIFWSASQYWDGIYEAAHHVPANAHNGFLDLVIDVGIVGFFFFVLAWIFTYVKALKLAYSNKEPAYLWPPIFLTLMILNNVMESILARQTNIFWVLFVTMAFTLNKVRIPEEHFEKSLAGSQYGMLR